jgi:hypothetical protein
MSRPRTTGLLLLLTGVLVLMGNTMDVLPPEAFWAGLMTYPIGGYLFFVGSRQAPTKFEPRHAKPRQPLGNAPVRPEQPAPESRIVESLRRPPQTLSIGEPKPDTLALYEIDGPESDEDAPPVGEQQGGIADQLEKLSKLAQQGTISAEEYAAAKAKLLG